MPVDGPFPSCEQLNEMGRTDTRSLDRSFGGDSIAGSPLCGETTLFPRRGGGESDRVITYSERISGRVDHRLWDTEVKA
jgi:hypothetical protein